MRVAVQRIALAHWSASATLRSWGLAPLHREGDEVLVPCAPAEALWIGAWLEEEPDTARVRMRDPDSGHIGTLALPRDYQLAALGVEEGAPEPLTLSGAHRTFTLELSAGDAHAALALTLLPPAVWSERSKREPPDPLGEPPPLPPRLG